MDRPNRPRHEDLTGVRRGGASATEASRRGRFHHHDGGPGSVPVVDEAECTAQTCRSCVAVTLADAIAVGCCPCAVLSLLGLAFIKAPLAVARRCLRQMRRRRGELRHKKRVGDLDDPVVAKQAKCRRSRSAAADADAASKCAWGSEADARGEVAMRARASSSSAAGSPSGRIDDEKVWMEMYQVGQWGFGRLSISVSPPPPVRPGSSPDSFGDGDGDGGRKDVDLQCES